MIFIPSLNLSIEDMIYDSNTPMIPHPHVSHMHLSLFSNIDQVEIGTYLSIKSYIMQSVSISGSIYRTNMWYDFSPSLVSSLLDSQFILWNHIGPIKWSPNYSWSHHPKMTSRHKQNSQIITSLRWFLWFWKYMQIHNTDVVFAYGSTFPFDPGGVTLVSCWRHKT